MADALVQSFCRVGIPEELVSDQGSNFISNLMAQLYDQLGITKIQTSVYHPEANSPVECFNGTLKRMLKKLESWMLRIGIGVQDMRIEHKSGRNHCNVDALTRF